MGTGAGGRSGVFLSRMSDGARGMVWQVRARRGGGRGLSGASHEGNFGERHCCGCWEGGRAGSFGRRQPLAQVGGTGACHGRAGVAAGGSSRTPHSASQLRLRSSTVASGGSSNLAVLLPHLTLTTTVAAAPPAADITERAGATSDGCLPAKELAPFFTRITMALCLRRICACVAATPLRAAEEPVRSLFQASFQFRILRSSH